MDPAPEAVQRLRDAIAKADAVLIATPEYNSSLPGQLKNALDWASRPFPGNALRNKPVAVIGASTGCSAPSGHRPRPARSWGPPGHASSTWSSRFRTPRPRSPATASPTPSVHENLAGIVSELIAAAEARPAELSAAA